MIRTFLAFDIDANLRTALTNIVTEFKQKLAAENIKWEPTENLHLTLQFYGAITPEKITELMEALNKISTVHSFQLPVAEIIHFPSEEKPHLVALSFPLTQELKQLQELINTASEVCGFVREARPFLPHLTLGRLKTPKQLDLQHAQALPKQLLIKELVLYRSDAVVGGTVYSEIKKFKLKT